MVKRPLLSVRALRFTPPCTDVAVMFAFSMGALSGPVMTPRMTSRPCAVAWFEIAITAMNAATTIDRMRRDTGACGRRGYDTGIDDARLDTGEPEKGSP